ncbi:MAG: cation:proton antiporter [Chloroflexota bacterium]
MEELGLIVDLVVVLVAALVGGFIARRARLPIVLGYVIGGILVGPYVLGLVSDVEQVETLASIGAVLLMFAIGMQFSFRTLKHVGKVAVVGGILQIAATIGLGTLVGTLLGWSLLQALLLGFVFALSSTMVVLKILMERGELGTAHGRVMVGILLVQDLAVVPMMVLLPVFAEPTGGLFVPLGIAGLKAVAFLGAMLVLGIWVLPWVMRRVVGERSRELFLLSVFALGLGLAFATYYFGLSMALGAFVAGLLISESEYVHQALAEVIPLRDVFATLFFASLGMLINLGFLVEEVATVILLVAAIVLGKSLICAVVARLFKYSVKTVLFVGAGLFQIGEFSFVLAAAAVSMGVIQEELYNLILSTAVVTILLTPLALAATSFLYQRLSQSERLARAFVGRGEASATDPSGGLRGHVVLCGYGRIGHDLGTILMRRNLRYLAIDIDPRVIDGLRAQGIPCIYGDSSNPAILSSASLERARMLVVTFADPLAMRVTVTNARRINPRLDIVARVHLDRDIAALRKLGVVGLVRPEFEGGLEIIRHTLRRFGVSGPEVQLIVNRLREERTKEPGG